MWNSGIVLFREYMGTGLIVILFLCALLYLFLKETRKPVRILFIYVPVLLLLVFFNPLVAKVIDVVADDEIYYRILWLVPITVVLAYTVAHIYNSLSGRKKSIFAIVAIIIVMISGSYIYSNPYFHKAENIYHVPQSVVEICESIEVEGREVQAVFPEELLQYVRQYSPVVCMPYGREQLVDRWNYYHELYQAMEADEIDAEQITELAREYWTVYIILPQEKKINGNMEEYEFELFDTVEGYVIYKDATVDLYEIFG